MGSVQSDQVSPVRAGGTEPTWTAQSRGIPGSAIAVLTIVLGVGWLAACSGGPADPAVSSSPPTVAASSTSASPSLDTTTESPEPATLSADAQECGAGVYAAGTASCPFALAVATELIVDPANRNLSAVYSPVTGKSYDVTCTGDEPTTCRTGRATVFVYQQAAPATPEQTTSEPVTDPPSARPTSGSSPAPEGDCAIVASSEVAAALGTSFDSFYEQPGLNRRCEWASTAASGETGQAVAIVTRHETHQACTTELGYISGVGAALPKVNADPLIYTEDNGIRGYYGCAEAAFVGFGVSADFPTAPDKSALADLFRQVVTYAHKESTTDSRPDAGSSLQFTGTIEGTMKISSVTCQDIKSDFLSQVVVRVEGTLNGERAKIIAIEAGDESGVNGTLGTSGSNDMRHVTTGGGKTAGLNVSTTSNTTFSDVALEVQSATLKTIGNSQLNGSVICQEVDHY